MVGLAVSIAIAFVYNGPAERMARDFDAVGLGTIAPAGSEGILVDAGANLAVRPLAEIDGRMRMFDGGTVDASDPSGLLAIGYVMLARSTQTERVLIATGFDRAALAKLETEAARDHVRVLAGPPSLARDLLVPPPPVQPIVERCPSWSSRHFHRGHHRRARWLAPGAALALLLVSAGLARTGRRASGLSAP